MRKEEEFGALPCGHLRCKGMLVTGDRGLDPNMAPFDATIWWCRVTQKSLGPDDGPVSLEDCRRERRCCAPPDSA
ncbi:MAG: hypothetical protein HYY16_01460 [Planctomycetes bacterium]|nr:hypothetical protein [Planctomycetota bacterium]